MALLGIEIGGTKLQVAVVSPAGVVIAACSDKVDPGGGAPGILAALDQVLGDRRLAAAGPIVAAGVGFGGPVDRVGGIVAVSHQVTGWSGFPLVTWVGERLGLPVTLENDSNAAAFAEAMLGAGRGGRVVVYSNAGSGVGAGLVIDGRIHHGRAPGEMELGHVRLSPDGPTVQEAASGWSLDGQVRAAIESNPAGGLAAVAAGETPSARLLGAALAAGDPEAAAILDRAARAYAFGLSHAVHLLNPDVVVLGGGVATLGEPWRRAVEDHLGRFVMEALRPLPPVRLSAVGDLVVPVGAALVAAQSLPGAARCD